MKPIISFMLLFSAACITGCSADSQPTVDQFKQVFTERMLKLKPDEVTRRTVKFVSVTKGKADGAYVPFTVTAYIHDYSPGYPRNHYYGRSCVGMMDGWTFNMIAADGAWDVQGRFTVSYPKCTDNTAEGTESVPVASVPGTAYQPGNSPVAAPDAKLSSSLYIGQYACYGTGGTLLGGMGFYLTKSGSYYDLDKARGGTYDYDSKRATISFHGGFLDGQTGTNVHSTGFQLSNTINAEPWH